MPKFSVSLPGPSNGRLKYSFGIEYLNLVVGTVQDKDPSSFSNSHLAGLIEISADIRDVFDSNIGYLLVGTGRRGRKKNPAKAQPKQSFA
jgi:hypothetical protein